jgi:hypothetical protein
MKVRLAPGLESSFKEEHSARSCVFEHPSDPCGSHSEPCFVDDNRLFLGYAHISEYPSEVVVEFLKTLPVCSRYEIVEEISVYRSRYVGFEI